MFPLPIDWRILGAFLAVCALVLFSYNKGATDNEAKHAIRERDMLAKYAERIKTAQEKHDEDQVTITRLAADARRVRVKFPTCPASGKDQDGSAGVLQQRVDELFAELQVRTGSLIERCDQLNIDAIERNGSVP